MPERSTGEIAADVSSAIVALFAEFYGRGPERAKTYLFDDYVLTVLHDSLTTAERTLVEGDREELVRDFRLAFQKLMTERFTGAVQEATGRRVLTYQSQLAFHPEVCFEFFMLGDPA